MTKHEINKFVKENWPEDKNPSLADIVDFQVRILMTDKLNSEMEKISDRIMPQDRLAENTDDAEAVAAASTADEILLLMRKNMFFSNQTALVRKALEMQDELVPLIIDRFKKSKRDFFVENAVKILAYADEKYTRELVGSYKEIWLPYAQALACYLFGYRGLMDTVPLLVNEYARFRRLYPNQSYATCPLMGLSYIAEKMEK